MLKPLFKFAKSKSILVCETDGFLLRAAVYVRAGNELAVLQTAESQQADMAEAVADVVTSLKNDGWQGGDAVLLSPTVLSTMLELQVNPKKPRPLAQMNELIRWEAEPLLVQHTTQCSVGNLLIARGYMTQEQADAVMDLQQGRVNPAGGLELTDKFSLRRFGDLAEELGFIKRSQLNACLAGQEWLKSDDDLIECGWSPQGEVSDIPGTYYWQVSAVTKSLLQRWTTVFQMQGITLQAMYPLAGASASLLSDSVQEQVLIESHPGMSSTTRIENNHIVEQHLYLDASKSPTERCLEAFHTQNVASDAKIYLSNWSHNEHNTHDDLASALDREIIDVQSNSITDKSSPGMIGAGLHYLGMGKNQWVSQVRLGGPLPALLHRPTVRGGLLLSAIALLILIAESVLLVRSNLVESHKAQVDERWQSMSAVMKRINGDIRQVSERKKQLKDKEVLKEREQQRFTFFGEELPERAALVQSILGILQESINDDIIVNSIDEVDRRSVYGSNKQSRNKDQRIAIENFNLQAWALSETAAQQFIQKLEQSAQPWGLEILNSNVVARPGPLNLQGFSVTLRIVKLVDPASLPTRS
ncbi:hypothetical protein [Psychrobium sp. 1_MG-2023]|uniref:hypothetical protein n=1 Tax=Psychrobium sp. 1_MG-2023 TaxID=3062624 RepID=UPI000C3457C5|nr:hypothetical protein [Psychrobium sp. 1_MG-2023]MDP2561782.1 hypothetical protein [Psychrobium sp. 1_MG-2023]PKF59734.1 hypothetical protein CW748_00600 [Alteromonadales bacterium alter-6D02]